MLFAFIAFWVLLIVGRDELGLSGIVNAIATWGILLAGALVFEQQWLFLTGVAALDILLVLVVFKGDLTIR